MTAIAVVVGLACLWWLCWRSPEIDFLGSHGSAGWIVYPKPADGAIHRSAEWSAVFRRSFTLDHTPAKVTLSMRAFKRYEARINGLTVNQALWGTEPDWKAPEKIDITGALHAGANEISVTVTNNRGPAALWLSLQADTFTLNTDNDWQASLAGAAWRNAHPASQPMQIDRGNPFFDRQSVLGALFSQWRTVGLFTIISVVVQWGGSSWARRFTQRRENTPSSSPGAGEGASECGIPKSRCGLVRAAFVVVIILWAALFINNLGLLPRRIGFDVDAHLDYINYIRSHLTLPLATDGWEMCQPPLYYLLSAILLSPFNAGTTSDTAVAVLRVFGLFLGIAQFTLILQSLRLIFPGQMRKQMFGLLLAGFLPAQLYISHYVTNEALSAVLVSAAIYFCLRILTRDEGSWRMFLAVGLCLGAALLTKITALFAAPFIFGALGVGLARRNLQAQTQLPATAANAQAAENDTGVSEKSVTRPLATLSVGERAGVRGIRHDALEWLRTLGLAAAAAFVVCGWHYLRVWKHFGTPIVHDWDSASGFAWWTDNGFQTSAYLTRFGACLTHPFYSVFHGFGDGLYSTFWGDGLCGGVIRLDRRPPWNYELMAAGFLLALVPTAIILAGAVVSVVRFLRRPEPVFFLLLGVPCLTFAALVYMNLKLPFYCNVKAFYCLTALLPVCALGAVGAEAIHQYAKFFRPVFWVLIGVWAINAYASFWIRRTPLTEATRAWYLAADGRYDDAAEIFSQLAKDNPNDPQAWKGLGLCLLQQGRLDQAKAQSMRALELDSTDADGHLQLGSILAQQGDLNAAFDQARLAAEFNPDSVDAHVRICSWLSEHYRWDAVVETGRDGLRIEPMNAELHLDIGVALTSLKRHSEALEHLRWACEFKPSWAEAHDRLGLCLSLLNRWPEAAKEFDTACGLKRDDPSFLFHLALGMQAIGEDRKAIYAYRQALRFDPDSMQTLNNLAWMLATDADPQIRDGAEAVRLAERARQIGSGSDASYRGTLAAAYAETGRFAEATTIASEALQIAHKLNQAELESALRQQLESYRANRPYHQPVR